jgi:type II secretory pathway pseudopilin PulG
MVMLVVAIAVMSIGMGVAVQTAEFQMRREREAELIFRGKQYVEAIRLYKIKYGRYPMQLKEIYEAKPRVIRKRWKDPITDSENWGIIFLGQEGRQVGQRGRQLAGPGGAEPGFDAQGRPVSGTGAGGRAGTFGSGAGMVGTQPPGRGSARGGGARGAKGSGSFGEQEIDPQTGLPRSSFGQAGADRKMGPIVGVHSTSTEESIKIYEGHTTYSEWRFIYREQPQPGRRGGQLPGQQPGQPPVGWHPGDELGTDDDGKPIKVPPGGNEPPGGGGVPDPVPTIPSP